MPLPRRAFLAAPLPLTLVSRGAAAPEDDPEPAAEPAAADAPPEIVVPHAVREDYYLVGGRTRQEIERSIQARRPGEFRGKTTWHVDWAFSVVTGPAGVTLRGFDVFVQIRHTLPRWDRPRVVGAATVHAWNRYIGRLVAHERGHARFGLDAAAEMLRDLAPPAAANAWTEPTAEALSDRLAARCDRILENYRAKEIDYDRRTDHGRRPAKA